MRVSRQSVQLKESAPWHIIAATLMSSLVLKSSHSCRMLSLGVALPSGQILCLCATGACPLFWLCHVMRVVPVVASPGLLMWTCATCPCVQHLLVATPATRMQRRATTLTLNLARSSICIPADVRRKHSALMPSHQHRQCTRAHASTRHGQGARAQRGSVLFSTHFCKTVHLINRTNVVTFATCTNVETQSMENSPTFVRASKEPAFVENG